MPPRRLAPQSQPCNKGHAFCCFFPIFPLPPRLLFLVCSSPPSKFCSSSAPWSSSRPSYWHIIHLSRHPVLLAANLARAQSRNRSSAFSVNSGSLHSRNYLAAMTNNTETPRGRGRNAQETPGTLLPQEQRTEVRNSYSEDGPGLPLAPALRPSPYPSPVHGVAGVNNTARGFHAPLSGHSALVEAAQTTEMAETAEAARSLREMSGLRIPDPQAPRATGESPACTSLKRRARKIRERRARKVAELNIISDDRAAMLLLRLSETGVNNDVPRPSLEMAHPEGSFGSVHTQSSRTTAGILWNWDYREICPNPQSSGPMWSLPPSGNGEAGSDDDDRTISDPPSPDSDSDSDSENFDDE